MELTREQQKEFEKWFYQEFLHNYDESTHMKVALLNCYKKFIVEPNQTRVVPQEMHEEGAFDMIVSFLQRMKSMYGMQVRQSINGEIVVQNPDTGFMKTLTEFQDKDLI